MVRIILNCDLSKALLSIVEGGIRSDITGLHLQLDQIIYLLGRDKFATPAPFDYFSTWNSHHVGELVSLVALFDLITRQLLKRVLAGQVIVDCRAKPIQIS